MKWTGILKINKAAPLNETSANENKNKNKRNIYSTTAKL
jgi:hypothetical protein